MSGSVAVPSFRPPAEPAVAVFTCRTGQVLSTALTPSVKSSREDAEAAMMDSQGRQKESSTDPDRKSAETSIEGSGNSAERSVRLQFRGFGYEQLIKAEFSRCWVQAGLYFRFCMARELSKIILI